jgi:hypothetical protein
MAPTPLSAGQSARDQDASFNASFEAVRKLRSQSVMVRPHRAFTPLTVTPWLAAQAALLPLVLCLSLWWARPLIDAFWRACMAFWAAALGLPFAMPPGLLTSHRAAVTAAAPVSDALSAIILSATLAGFVFSYRLRKSWFPLRYPLRIVCVIQAVSVLYFQFPSQPFPYDVTSHGQELLTMGYALLLCAPLMLGLGYYMLNESLWKKLWYTALILLFFTLMVPHQVMLHALILQKGSLMFMPVLYFCFGAIFDALAFVALYSWAASNTGPAATI